MRKVKLSCTCIDDDAAVSLTKVLMSMPVVEELFFDDNGFSDRVFAPLAKLIGALTTLSTLSVEHTCLQCRGLVALVSQLSKLCLLWEINFSDTDMGFRVVLSTFAQNLCCLTALQKLDLKRTALFRMDEGITSFLASLAKLSCLEYLDLTHCGVTSNILQLWGYHMMHMTSLQELILCINPIPYGGCRVLERCARQMPSLQILCFNKPRKYGLVYTRI